MHEKKAFRLIQNCHPDRSEASQVLKNEILHYAQNDKHAFQVLGRIDHSDIRGCSLLVS